MTQLTAAKNPCGSCPYRCDVPSGVWEKHEYDKLLRYDGQTWEQSTAVFMCHQRDGTLCAGWLACHNPRHLLALRMTRDVDPTVFDYTTPTPVFKTGAEARAHGLAEVSSPGKKAVRLISKIQQKASSR